MCGNFKASTNQMIESEQYPLPTMEDMLVKIGVCVKFAEADMEEAHHQLEPNEKCRSISL